MKGPPGDVEATVSADGAATSLAPGVTSVAPAVDVAESPAVSALVDRLGPPERSDLDEVEPNVPDVPPTTRLANRPAARSNRRRSLRRGLVDKTVADECRLMFSLVCGLIAPNRAQHQESISRQWRCQRYICSPRRGCRRAPRATESGSAGWGRRLPPVRRAHANAATSIEFAQRRRRRGETRGAGRLPAVDCAALRGPRPRSLPDDVGAVGHDRQPSPGERLDIAQRVLKQGPGHCRMPKIRV